MYIIIDKEAIDNFYRMSIQSQLRLFRKCFAVSQPPRLLSYFEVGIFYSHYQEHAFSRYFKIVVPRELFYLA